nr:abc transporter f family member 5 [Quercus suber]
MSRTVGKEFVRAFKEEMEIAVKLEKVQEALKGANVLWMIWMRYWLARLTPLVGQLEKKVCKLSICHARNPPMSKMPKAASLNSAGAYIVK